MRVVAPNAIARPRNARTGRFITTADAEFGFSPICAIGATTVSGSWASANDPVAVPFRISEALVVTHLGWRNGSGAGSNHDIGIYDTAWNLLVSSGSTGGSGSSLWQFVDVTDTPIPPGRYYLTYVVNATTANRSRYWNNTSSLVLTTVMGLKETSTDSFPLPSSLSGLMGDPITITRVPIIAFGVKGPLA